MSSVPAAPLAVPGELTPGIEGALVLSRAAQRSEAASQTGCGFQPTGWGRGLAGGLAAGWGWRGVGGTTHHLILPDSEMETVKKATG